MDDDRLAVFALSGTRALGDAVVAALGRRLDEHEERDFEDGEHKSRPLVSVRGRDAFVIQSLYSDARETVNDKLCKLLFFLSTLRDASAQRVTAVIPYLAYARKDRRTKARDPVTSRYVAALIEAAGAQRVLTMDVHNLAAFQNAFRCPAEHLEANKLFIEALRPRLHGAGSIAVVSPDAGGVKRAELFRQALAAALDREVSFSFLEKTRSAGELRTGRLFGDVGGAAAIILDDLIATGGTLLNAARACRDGGAKSVYAVATHGVFTQGANAVLADEAFDAILVSDTVVPFRLDPKLIGGRVQVVPAAGLFAEAIRRVHTGGSLVDLLAT